MPRLSSHGAAPGALHARMRTRHRRLAALLLTATLAAAGCEGLFTGTRDSVHALSESADGSFAPVRLELNPDMNPIALNLRGTTIASQAESGRWNSYRATLALNGAPIATGSFNVNNRGTSVHEEGGDFATTMLIVSVPQTGEYELSIIVAKPKEITIESPRLEVRRNTKPPIEPKGG